MCKCLLILRNKKRGFLRREKIMVALAADILTPVTGEFFAGLVETHKRQIVGVLDKHHVGDVFHHRVKEVV